MSRFLSPFFRTLFKPPADAGSLAGDNAPADDISLKIDAAVQETERVAAAHSGGSEARLRTTFDDLFRRMGKHDDAHG